MKRNIAVTTPIYIIASLWIHDGAEAAFEAYERKASLIMQKYSGQIDLTVRPSAQSPSLDQPFEVHIIRFPSHEMFEAYCADPELKALSPERNHAISKTEVLVGNEGPTYTTQMSNSPPPVR